MLRRFVRAPFRAVGLEIRRIDRTEPTLPPPLFQDPLEALHHARAGVPVAFACPLSLARDTKGFSFATDGWHPWVAEILDQRQRGHARYAGSLLEKYFRVFSPGNALDALAGLAVDSRCGLAGLPSHLFWLTPWWPGSAAKLDRDVKEWLVRGARQQGFESFDVTRDGTPYHGPVSRQLGEVEVRRLSAVVSALEQEGYDRQLGDSLFYLVRRGREFVAVKFGGGYHRTAAMAALGHAQIPARLRPPHAVDVGDVDDWPQVRSGMWSREAALTYVDHLFDFDARAWASSVGLR